MKITLKQALAASKDDLIAAIRSHADRAGDESWLFMPKSSCPDATICLVAHVDTIFDCEPALYVFRRPRSFWQGFRQKKKNIYYDQWKRVYWSPDGLGADDRAGVYACLALRELTGCMVLLTDHEESGGSGAREAARLFKDEFLGLTCFVEIDRRGRREAVYYSGESRQFREWVSSFGFNEHVGTFSDISVLSKETNIVGVNVSAGYYNQHSRAEYLRVSDLEDTIRRVYQMITRGGDRSQRKEWTISTVDEIEILLKKGGKDENFRTIIE